MASKAVVSLMTGMEDPEKVTVAFLVAVGAAETGHETLMFLTKEAVRVAVAATAVGVACEGCPSLTDLVKRYEAAGVRYYVRPICFNARRLDAAGLIPGAELNGTVPPVAVDRRRSGHDVQLLIAGPSITAPAIVNVPGWVAEVERMITLSVVGRGRMAVMTSTVR